MKLIDLIIFFTPIILSLIISRFCNVSSDSGSNINARPPPYVFGIVWTILYIFIGISWIYLRHYQNKNIVDALFIVLNILLNFWIIKYNCNKDKKGALFVFPFIILTTLILIVYGGGTISTYLLLPLLVWLIYAMMLNYTDVNTNT